MKGGEDGGGEGEICRNRKCAEGSRAGEARVAMAVAARWHQELHKPSCPSAGPKLQTLNQSAAPDLASANAVWYAVGPWPAQCFA